MAIHVFLAIFRVVSNIPIDVLTRLFYFEIKSFYYSSKSNKKIEFLKLVTTPVPSTKTTIKKFKKTAINST